MEFQNRPAIPLLQQDLIGNTKNYYPDKSRGFTFGRAPAVQNVRVDLWEGPTTTYVFPTVSQQMKVRSDNLNDTASGTGCQQIHIHYLDDQYNVQFERVTLNGTNYVNTVATNILRINGVHSVAVGSNGSPLGNISIVNLAATVTYAYMSAGLNTARQAIYTVPAGVTGYVNHWQASSGSAGNHFCQIELRATTHLNVLYPGVFILQDNVGSQNGGQEVTFPIPLPIPATADVKLSAISDAVNANVIALGAILGWFEPVTN